MGEVSDVQIAALALHQRAAPIEARERLLEIAAPWRELSDLATCHRVEVYLTGAAAERLTGVAGDLASDGIGDGLVELSGGKAVAHLFEVASGLDSAVQGESQIRGQVRATLSSAPASLDPVLRRLLERALQLGRSLRGASGLATVSRSVGSLAVDEIVRLLPRPERSTVLVVGAGETGTLAVRALSRPVGRVVVANRDRARAEVLAKSAGAEAIGLAEVASRLAGVDGVVSAADTRGSILTEGLLSRRLAHGPLALVDIAVPRSVGPEARALRGLRYRSVDDLDGARPLPEPEVDRLRAACLAEADRFLHEVAGRAAAEAISQVRARANAVRVRQLERALRRLGHLSARDRRVVEALSAGVVNALLHEPTIALKRDPARGEQALALFGIERQPP